VIAPRWRPRREAPAAPEPWPPPAAGLRPPPAAAWPDDGDNDAAPLPARPARWPARGLAGLATAGLAGWLSAHLVASAPVTPLVVALLAGMLVAALPRAGWLAFVLAFAVWLAFENRTGAAVVVALGGVLPALLAPWRATMWPRAVGAPALGALGLAGAWPGLAARARGAPTRAALGAVGWTWTALGTSLSGTALYLRAPPGTPPASQWFASAGETVRHVLEPLLSSGALAPALVWAAAAVVLPWLVRGRHLAVDFVLASAWAAGLLAATYSSLAAVHGSLSGAPVPRGVLGAVAALAIVMEPSLVRAVRARRVSAQVP
jgi:hypothetical protein